MSNVLTYPELWLLERGVESNALWIPFALLPDTVHERKKGFSEQWNAPPHGLSGKQLSEVMWILFDRGAIEFQQSVSPDPESLRAPLSPVSASDVYDKLLSDVEEYRRRRKASEAPWPLSFYYRVTSHGIALWEEYALPNWDRYRGGFSGRLEEPGETVWSNSATTEAFARDVLDVYATDPFHPATLHWETATVILHRPWVPFAGKELPQGVTFSLKVTEHGQKSFGGENWQVDDAMKLRALIEEHHRRFREISRWYQNRTFNHPDKPRPQPDTPDHSE